MCFSQFLLLSTTENPGSYVENKYEKTTKSGEVKGRPAGELRSQGMA